MPKHRLFVGVGLRLRLGARPCRSLPSALRLAAIDEVPVLRDRVAHLVQRAPTAEPALEEAERRVNQVRPQLVVWPNLLAPGHLEAREAELGARGRHQELLQPTLSILDERGAHAEVTTSREAVVGGRPRLLGAAAAHTGTCFVKLWFHAGLLVLFTTRVR